MCKCSMSVVFEWRTSIKYNIIWTASKSLAVNHNRRKKSPQKGRAWNDYGLHNSPGEYKTHIERQLLEIWPLYYYYY